VSLAPGDKVQFAAPVAGDSLVVRYSYPDSADGSGLSGRLRVGVGTAPAADLPVTSAYCWDYGTPAWGSSNVWNEGPSAGRPRHFWDEAGLRTTAYQAGTPVWIGNPPGSGVTVLVDLVDFEAVGPAVAAPAGARVFWGDATGTTDVTSALQAFLAGGGTVYLPEGTYRIGSVDVGTVTLQGAGLWRSRFVGPASRLHFTGGQTHLADFAVFGETATRNDQSDAGNALAGVPAAGSTVSRLWIEHKKCAFWFGNWGATSGPTGITLTSCRFRNTMADAVNLCSGTTGTVVQDCLIRNTGDDALAAWSPQLGGNPVGGNNQFLRNLVQVPWLANGIALYGGGPFTVTGNVVKDTVTTGSGLYVASLFSAWAFSGATVFQGNLLVRAGSHESDAGGPTGAIRVIASEKDLTGATFTFQGNTVVAPVESAVSIQGPRNTGALTFTDLSLQSRGTAWVADVRSGAAGSAAFSGTLVDGLVPDAGWWRNSAAAFILTHEGDGVTRNLSRENPPAGE